jgi:hypothetical protein
MTKCEDVVYEAVQKLAMTSLIIEALEKKIRKEMLLVAPEDFLR